MVPVIIDLDPDDFTPMTNKQNLYVVIHYTGNNTDSARNNAKYFKNGKRYASAHYFVDPTEIVQIVRDSDASWGVGKKYGDARLWSKCTNANSINVEMCSTNGKIDDATMKNTAELVRSLMEKYNIPIQNVVRHYDVCAKRCPGWDGWLPNNESEWNRLLAMIQNTEPVVERNLVPVEQPSGVSGSRYSVGSVYTLTTNLRVRTGAGTNNPAKSRSQLTPGGMAHANANGSLLAGTKVTCQAVTVIGNETWIKIPSGWICAIQNGSVYVK